MGNSLRGAHVYFVPERQWRKTSLAGKARAPVCFPSRRVSMLLGTRDS